MGICTTPDSYSIFDFTYIVLLEIYICWEIKKNSDNSKLKRSISMESEKTWKEQGQEAKKHKDQNIPFL